MINQKVDFKIRKVLNGKLSINSSPYIGYSARKGIYHDLKFSALLNVRETAKNVGRAKRGELVSTNDIRI